MPESKISALTELAALPADGDLLVLVDVSDTTMAASGTNKKIQATNLIANPIPTLVIPGDDTYQLDPPNAPHDCTILYTADYGDGGHFRLPALANHPDAGTRYRVVVRPSTSGDTSLFNFQKASTATISTIFAPTAGITPIVVWLTYLGSNLWEWTYVNAQNGSAFALISENAD